MKRYSTCQFDEGGDCAACSLSNYNRDCRNNPTNTLAYYRTSKGLTQSQLAKLSNVNVRQIQRLEASASDMSNVTLKNAVALAGALGVYAEDLLNG